jgi:hypothetical protein
VKEQTAPELSERDRLPHAPFRARAPRVPWPLPSRWHKPLVAGLFVALALLATAGYGSGLQLNDGNVVLHLIPFKFLGQLLHAWNPSFSLGTHTGYWVPYETPYGWAYGLAALLHLSQELAQRLCLFLVYLGCLVSMYYCLRSVTPRLDEVARLAGSCAYLFNMYVALNSQAQIVWLLTYATLPAMVGVTARAMRGELGIWRAALAIALLVFVGAGVNPPLLAINVIILAIYVIVTIAFDSDPAARARQALPFAGAASVASLAINLYWLVPFVDYFHYVWLNGVLSEAPSMHNAASSFSNVLRGLGHWATFVSFGDRPYFPWASSYAAGFFSAGLWLIPIIALVGIAFKRNRSVATLYFLLVTIVSIPLVVGYYKDDLGDAITSPVYDLFYRNFPGFQMFRFSYKWVAGVEFGMCGLYALAAGAILTASRERLIEGAASLRERFAWTLPAAGAALVLLPILLFIPVLQKKANYPGPVIPSWEYRENQLLGDDRGHRVAIFPTQFLEQFDWGSPEFYIEDAFIDRPIIYGRLGSESTEGSDHWIRGAYRATRYAMPLAADMFRVLNVDTILQRDDFVPAIDFSFPDYWVPNNTTLTHDLLHRVLGAQPVRSYGPLRVYHLAGALPLVYGVVHPKLSSLPPFTDAYLGDVHAMAAGAAQFTLPAPAPAPAMALIESLAPILPGTDHQVRDLAVEQSLAENGIKIHPPSADITIATSFTVKSPGRYLVFAREDSPLFYRPAPSSLDIDGQFLSPQNSGGAWTEFGTIDLDGGDHQISDGFPDPNLTVALVRPDALHAWEDRIAALQRALPGNLSATRFVNQRQTRVLVAQAGRYRITARAAAPIYWQDGDERTHLLWDARSSANFLTALSTALPYVLGLGTAGTGPVMMPQSWYQDPSVYRWQRGDTMSWFLFSADGNVQVFVPGKDGVLARVRAHISRLQVSPVMRVAVNGRVQRSVVLPGKPAASDVYDSQQELAGPSLATVGFTLTLRPGWNDVAFGFDPLAGERTDLGTGVISAAVAPDLSFTRVARVAAPPASGEQTQAPSNVIGVAVPHNGLAGSPELQGSAAGTGGRVSLAVAIAEHGRIVYRITPITWDGNFDIGLLNAFPNGWNDVSKRIVGLWFVAGASSPVLSNLSYRVHAMPTLTLRDRNAFARLPVQLDGRPIGAQAVFLSRGDHLIESAEHKLKIERLTVDPVNLPKTRSFGLSWKRRSPTQLEVNVKNASRPFLLVFGESYHPEWQATLDGKTLTHVPVNGVANGWLVPRLAAPSSDIELSFTAQRKYNEAAAVSLVSLIVLLALAFAPMRLRRPARGS